MVARRGRPAGRGRGRHGRCPLLWVLLQEGRPAAPVAVTPGIGHGRMTEITGGNLRAGMQ